ncbi:MAG: MerR family transcriptional regulator [Lachnospiraceae bacterium]|nr:MerR family transcriptional regulator [Lachnospiraceae bacterium]
MRTVKEIAAITGISARTLHYYDEIGLLKPTNKSEAGYRLYDDKALEKLQQILFFREFDIPLKEIKTVMENPSLDKNQILKMQRGMLLAKKERMERLIKSIDNILKGDKAVDFEVFSKTEIEEIFNSMIRKMQPEQKNVLTEKFGSVEKFRKHFMEEASSEQTQRNWKKLVEWYGGKDLALEAATNPVGTDVIHACNLRQESIMQKLTERMKQGYPVTSFEIKEIIGEYAFVQKQLLRIKYEKDFMLQLANLYQTNEQIKKTCDTQYGEGVADFFAKAVKTFYKKNDEI